MPVFSVCVALLLQRISSCMSLVHDKEFRDWHSRVCTLHSLPTPDLHLPVNQGTDEHLSCIIVRRCGVRNLDMRHIWCAVESQLTFPMHQLIV